MSIDLAKRCFSDNLQQYIDIPEELEKQNLYTGLFLLAQEIESIGNALRTLQKAADRQIEVEL